MIAGFLSRVDLFGVPVSMNFYGKPKSTSNLGGICSLLFFGFAIWAIYNASRDLIHQTNPKTIRSEIFNDDPSEIIITPEIFPLAFQVESSIAGIFINDSIYTFDMFHVIHTKIVHEDGSIEENETKRSIKTEKCTAEHFEELASSYSPIISTQSRCIARNQSDLINQITVKGVYESIVSHQLIAQVSLCNNKTSTVTCASQDTFTSYLTGAWFRFVYPNMVINPQNFANPDSRFRDSYAGVINPVNFRQMQIGLGHIEVVDDVGWLTEDIKYRGFIRVNSADSTVQPRTQSSDIVLSCIFGGNKLAMRYSRTYKKVQDILAEVGALANATLVVTFLLMSSYFRYKYREALMNELFDISLSPSKKKEATASKATNIHQDTNPSHSHVKSQHKINLEAPRIIPNHLKHLLNKSKTPQKQESIETNQSLMRQKRTKKSSSFAAITEFKKISVENLGAALFKEKNKEGDSKTPRFMNYSTCNLKRLNRRDISSQELPISIQMSTTKLNPKILTEPEDESPIITFRCQESTTSLTAQKENQDAKVESKKEEKENKSSSENLEKSDSICIDFKKEGEEEDKMRGKSSSNNIKNNQIEGITRTESTKCELTVWEYICSFFFAPTSSLKKKIAIIDEGLKKVDMRLDFVNIMKKLREIDKLRTLLLDDDQLVLYNSLPRPRLTLEDSLISRRKINKNKNLCSSAFVETAGTETQVSEAYEKLLQKESKTKIDEKLIKLFEDFKS